LSKLKQGPKTGKNVGSKSPWNAFTKACEALKSNSASNSTDPEMAFGRFVGMKLKSMPEPKRNRTMSSIMTLLVGEEPSMSEQSSSQHFQSSQITPSTSGFQSSQALQPLTNPTLNPAPSHPTSRPTMFFQRGDSSKKDITIKSNDIITIPLHFSHFKTFKHRCMLVESTGFMKIRVREFKLFKNLKRGSLLQCFI
jgi:hypothetical protein